MYIHIILRNFESITKRGSFYFFFSTFMNAANIFYICFFFYFVIQLFCYYYIVVKVGKGFRVVLHMQLAILFTFFSNVHYTY